MSRRQPEEREQSGEQYDDAKGVFDMVSHVVWARLAAGPSS